MKLITIMAASSALLAFAGTAAAQDNGAYGHIGVEALDYDGASGNIVGRVGYDFAQYFGVEGEGSVGVMDDNDDFKIDYKVAGFVRAKAPIGEQFEVFSRVGYYHVDSELGDADGLAFGGGLEYFLNPSKKDSLRLDYTHLEARIGNADVYAITYGRRF